MNQFERPDLVLRVGFTGNRWGPPAGMPIRDSGLRPKPTNERVLIQILSAVFDEIEGRLLAIAAEATSKGRDSRIVQFYSANVPTLRLVTGLAEGADQLAALTLNDRAKSQALSRELAAVLPCAARAYRASREPWHWPDFDALMRRCAYVLELDGICDTPHPDTALSNIRRARAYRAQGAFLLRHCDVLLAMADLSEPGRAGGTLETVARAMAFQLPVILIDAKTGDPHLLEPTDDLSEILGRPVASDWRERVRGWVSILAAGPDTKPSAAAEPAQVHDFRVHATVELFLEEFFAPSLVPPKDRDGVRRPTIRERLWNRFSSSFHLTDSRRRKDAASDRASEPFATWRKRATELNYHYIGLYRGAFILNYALAVVAVTLATLSLVLIGTLDADPAAEGVGAALTPALLVLAFFELLCIVTIFWNTRSANNSGWNDKAIDYRYLSERLRCALYLPTIGSARPPVPAKAQFTSRVLRQSAVDWLFEAMTRHVSPFRIEGLRRTAAADSTHGDARLLRLEPAAILEAMRNHWIEGQLDYHKRNAVHMNSMHHRSERIAANLNLIVIGAVAVDLFVSVLVVLSERFGLPHWHVVETLHRYAPWLIFLAAVLPATVASLNGVRFQSECHRLADRSRVMVELLQGNAKRARVLAEEIRRNVDNPAINLGSWSADVLHLAEYCGRELVEEATEWSVLYAKEVHEP